MMKPAQHLAQFNIARIAYPLDDPRMAEFADNVHLVNGIADQIEGFVWRLKDDSGHAMNMRVYDDPRILPNLTVWENAQALERFVWRTLHRRFYLRRQEWFVPVDGPPLVMWWIPAGHRPSLAEGVERLDELRAQGPSARAFGWANLADAQLWQTMAGADRREVAA